MIYPSEQFYSSEFHGPYELISIGDLPLAEGGVLPDVQLAVATFGQLNAERTNAILIPTAFAASHAIWEQIYIGPEHALNPEEYFIIVVNQLGGGLSTSPHNIGGALAGPAFPRLRISDDVDAQHKLVTEHYGLTELALVVSCSMGAQQTYEWAVRYPDMVKRAAPIAGTAKQSAFNHLYGISLMEAITSDPGFAGGHYSSNLEVSEGLARHGRLWGVLGFTPEFWNTGGYRGLDYKSHDQFLREFLVESHQCMDPHALLAMTWKWQNADVSRNTNEDLAAALGRIQARTFVMPIVEDMFFTLGECEQEQALIPGSELRPIQAVSGHFGLRAFEPEYMPQINTHLRELLALPVSQ